MSNRLREVTQARNLSPDHVFSGPGLFAGHPGAFPSPRNGQHLAVSHTLSRLSCGRSSGQAAWLRGVVSSVTSPTNQPTSWAGQKTHCPPANKRCPTVWVAGGGDIKMGGKPGGWEHHLYPFTAPLGSVVPSSHLVAPPHPASPPRAGLRVLTWPPSKVDSAQNNLIVQALLKIASLGRRLWQGRAGVISWNVDLLGQVLMTVNNYVGGRT